MSSSPSTVWHTTWAGLGLVACQARLVSHANIRLSGESTGVPIAMCLASREIIHDLAVVQHDNML